MQREVLWGSKARWPCPGTAPHRGASPGTLFEQWRVPVGLRPPAPFSISATDNDSRGGLTACGRQSPLAMWLHAIGLPRAFAGSAGLRPSTPTKALAAAAVEFVRRQGARCSGGSATSVPLRFALARPTIKHPCSPSSPPAMGRARGA